MAKRRTKKQIAQERRLRIWGSVLVLVVLAGLVFLWVQKSRPEHLPWTPLNLEQPIGYATHDKLVALRDDRSQCMALLEQADVKFRKIAASGLGECRADDQVRLGFGPPLRVAFAPEVVEPSCPVAAAYVMWQWQVVQPAAERIYGERVTMVEQLGSHVCRKIAGSSSWSEHSTANAIDIAAFKLAGGRRISVIGGWNGESAQDQAFLREVREGACGLYSTVLSPDYNRAHRDHLHLDMAQRQWGSVCR